MNEKPPVVISCDLCGWSTSAGSWRPAKKIASAHRQAKHPETPR